ncbi:MAG: hypothetical protein WDN06_08100 [Asticcacaulis sp.]
MSHLIHIELDRLEGSLLRVLGLVERRGFPYRRRRALRPWRGQGAASASRCVRAIRRATPIR